jgi:transposase
MSMIQVTFTAEEKEIINYERFHHPHPQVQRQMEILWCKSLGKSHQEIAAIAAVHPNSVTNCLKEYQQGGLDAVRQLHFYQPQSELQAHQTTLKAYFEQHPCASLKEAAAKIEALTGLKRSLPQVEKFLKKMGLKYRKVGCLPAKADPDQQADFLSQQLQPRLDEAQAGLRTVFFVDAAHFVLAPFLGFLWCFTRVFIPAPAGRQRFNVLAALNAVTHDLVLVSNDSYITATSVCALLHQLAALKLTLPITLVLDNARYQRCALVQNLAATLHIELLYLPAYSPNLNLIERLWKFVKKEALYSQYYQNFASFKAAITEVLNETSGKHKQALDSLLTLNFQTFEKSQIMTL